jgi:L-serine deaminase
VDRDGRPISVDQLIDQMRHKTPIMSMRYIKQARKLEIGEAFFGEVFG